MSKIFPILGILIVLSFQAPAGAVEHKTHRHHSHKHGKKCGHEEVAHGSHTDYKHGQHMHKDHDGHVDECATATLEAPSEDAPASE